MPEQPSAVRYLRQSDLLPPVPAPPVLRAAVHEPHHSIADRFAGAVVGACVGSIAHRLLNARRAGSAPPLVTPLTCLLETVLLGDGRVDPEGFAGRLERWVPEDGAQGRALRSALRRRRDGAPWFRAGVRSAGYAAAARVVPVALGLAHDIDALRRSAALQTVVTHAHPTAVAGSVAQAIAIANCLATPPGRVRPNDLLRRVWRGVQDLFDPGVVPRGARGDAEPTRLVDRLRALAAAWAMGDGARFEVAEHPLLVTSALPAALACFAASPDDPNAVLVRAAGGGPAAAGVASMAGALAGAASGLSRFDDEWLRGRWIPELVELAGELHASLHPIVPPDRTGLGRRRPSRRRPRSRELPLFARAGADGSGANEPRALAATLESVRVGEPTTVHGLSLYPIRKDGTGVPAYLTGPAAWSGELLHVQERGGGVVPELEIENRGDRPVLLVEGELIEGAKQTRTLNVTVLLPPAEKTILPVSCVEQGRWGAARAARGSSHHSPVNVRHRKTRGVARRMRERGERTSNQGEVWQEVDSSLRWARAHSMTSSIVDAYERPGRARRELPPDVRPTADQVGVAVGVDGRIVCVDLFDSPVTLEAYWDRLLRSYLMQSANDEAWTPEPHAVQAILAALAGADARRSDAVGLGEELYVAAPHVDAMALRWEGSALHVAAFPNVELP